MNYIIKTFLSLFLLLIVVPYTSCFYENSSYFNNEINTVKYHFTVDGDGGVISQNSISVSNDRVTINTPVKNGYRFRRFVYVKDDGVSSYTSGRNVLIDNINNRVLRAEWQMVTYTISYTLNGGICEEEMVTSYNVLSDPITLCKPYKYGFTFLGWSGSNGNNIQETVVIPTGSYGNKTYAATYRRDI